MAKKSKLLNALDRYKGVDYELERQKKLQKQAEKRKRAKLEKRVNGAEVGGNDNGISGQANSNQENHGESPKYHAEIESDNDAWETEGEEEEEDEEEEDENEDESMVSLHCIDHSHLSLLIISNSMIYRN